MIKKIITFCFVPLALVSNLSFADEEQEIEAFKQALQPCVDQVYKVFNGESDKDPSSKMLNKCAADATKAMPGMTKELAMVCIGYNAAAKKYASDQTNENETENEQSQSEDNGAIQITATKLVEAYEENEIQADNDFKGKTVIVSGTVGQISKTLGQIHVKLKGDEYGFKGVDCLVKDEKVAAKLKKGQQIKIKGECNGLSLIDVYVKDAVVM